MDRSLDRMRPEDLDEVLAIERVCFRTPWSRAAFRHELEQNPVARCWVVRGPRGCRADDEGRVDGYLCLWEVADEVHVTNLAIRPEARGRGLARAMLTATLDGARQRGLRLVVLEVRPDNAEARGLYEDLGFVTVGRRPGYYADTGEDALVMHLSLAGAPPGASSEVPQP